MADVLDILRSRGFVANTTHDKELDDYLSRPQANCYIGFDPTASSLHVGNLVPIMALAHMQRNGHRPIALVGGGTGLVGDPSGKTEMRKILHHSELEENAGGIKQQLSHFIDFDENRALLVDNATWLKSLEYIPFLRDIGRHFSVNRMVKAESYKLRLESEEGLSFIEFNYMLLQAYDFLQLYDTHDCRLQMGGNDQWGNIIAGIELVRKMRQETVFGITFPLITTSSGEKMGKTAKGAVWLDKTRTSPYDYYQYWINTDDRDVVRFLSLFTFLPHEEIREVEPLKSTDLNCAKTVLAYETTRLVHGQEEADKTRHAASRMFGLRLLPKTILPSSLAHGDTAGAVDDAVPQSTIDESQLKSGIPAFKLFQMVGLTGTGGESRRLIAQGGAYINGRRVDAFDALVTGSDMVDGAIILRSGKKRFHKVRIDPGG